MGERGKTKIEEITLVRCGDRRRFEAFNNGYWCVVYSESVGKDVSILMRYSPSPFKGSHRAEQHGDSMLNCTYLVKDKAINHVAFGPHRHTHSRMYYSLEQINVQP